VLFDTLKFLVAFKITAHILIPFVGSLLIDGIGAYLSCQRIVVQLVVLISEFVLLLSASISIPQGAGVDVARLYIAFAIGLFFLNCLQFTRWDWWWYCTI
jgi:hypothetical protein